MVTEQDRFTVVIMVISVCWKIRYGDGAGNTIEENSSIFSLIRMH